MFKNKRKIENLHIFHVRFYVKFTFYFVKINDEGFYVTFYLYLHSRVDWFL
jgi:hypothetical protein